MHKPENLSSLAEIARDLRINKSQLYYYYTRGLIQPIAKAGKMNVFDKSVVAQTIKKIEQLRKGKKRQPLSTLTNG